jgi:hypothetical protein
MARVCLTCGRSDNIEAHHVAGRRNHPVTVDVCVDCHRILSIWQRAAGIELHESVDGAELDAKRALLVGAIHLVQMFAQRHADGPWFPNWLAIHTARAISKLLDQIQPVDRVGRWLPDPTVVPTEAAPVEAASAARRRVSEAEQIAEIAHLGGALCKITKEIPQLPIATLHQIVEQPGRWIDAFDQAMQDQTYADALVDLVHHYIELSKSMIINLLQIDDLDQVDEMLLEEATAWFDCMRQLLTEVHRITDSGMAVAS